MQDRSTVVIEAAAEAQAMAAIYTFLATVFTSHPTQATVDGMRSLAAELGVPMTDDIELSALDREYMALFVVPNPRYVAPYESVFRDRWLLPIAPHPGAADSAISVMIKGLVMGESTLAVRACYRQAGISFGEDLPDHIGNELRFMGYLWTCQAQSCDDQASALAAWRRHFRDNHLLAWIGDLRERLAESDELGYYGIALKVAEIILREDARL